MMVVGVDQCDMAAPRRTLPSAMRSNGKARLHAAVRQKTAAETKTGRDGEMDRRVPASTGAATPVLEASAKGWLWYRGLLTVLTRRRRYRKPCREYWFQKSRESCRLPGQPDPSVSPTGLHKTAYMAVAAVEMSIELRITARFEWTLMNTKVDRPVASVMIAKDFRLPRRVWIIHAPS